MGLPMSRRQFGFSLLEVMISAVLLMVIALGVLPMFLQAAASNEIGREYMEVSNFAKSRAEEYAQNGFNSPALTITSGTQLVASEYYSAKTRTWLPGTSAIAASAGDLAMWVRTTTVRQFSFDDLTTPLSSSADPGTIHLKEVTVDVQGMKLGNIPGSGKRATVRTLRSQ